MLVAVVSTLFFLSIGLGLTAIWLDNERLFGVACGFAALGISASILAPLWIVAF